MTGDEAVRSRWDEGCTCQSCGYKFRVDLIVPDEVWERIRPAGTVEGGGLLCGPCIIMALEAEGEFGVHFLVDLLDEHREDGPGDPG